ncbi:MAG: DinB family protein [Ferruginibacter sp.]
MAWKTQNKNLDELLAKLSDEELAQETAPGRNTGSYLLGHLTAVNDSLFKFLGFGALMYPELDDIFLRSPDRSGKDIYTVKQLREYWSKVNAALYPKIDAMPVAEWFTRHSAVSEEDFKKEPHRNKLNIILNRTTHQGYHLGQMAYLKK